MAKLRSVSTSFWSDPFIEELSPIEKLLFLYLITNEKTNMLGVYESSDRKISFETGIELVMVSNALKRFESLGKVKRVGNWIILVNFLKHQSFNTNMKKSAIDAYNGLPKELMVKDLDISKANPSEGFERLLKGFGMVRKVEVEYEIEKEVEGEKEIREIEVIDSIAINSFYALEVLKRHYLSNDKVIKAVVDNKENGFTDTNHLKSMLEVFESHLTEQAETIKTPVDFAKHFKDWHRSRIKHKAKKLDNSNPKSKIAF